MSRNGKLVALLVLALAFAYYLGLKTYSEYRDCRSATADVQTLLDELRLVQDSPAIGSDQIAERAQRVSEMAETAANRIAFKQSDNSADARSSYADALKKLGLAYRAYSAALAAADPAQVDRALSAYAEALESERVASKTAFASCAR